MIDMNEVEKQLRSWAPRRPSAKLERQILAALTAPAPHRPLTLNQAFATDHKSPPFRLSWLAPATVTFLLMCVLFNQHNTQAISGSANSGMIAVALSNQSAAAWLPGSFSRERNGLPNESFEWTNGNGSTSSISSLSGSRGTN
jgi:hypothetical protein